MSQNTLSRRLAIIGRGRVGCALAVRFRDSGYLVVGPLDRSYEALDVHGVEVVLLCVPDREIESAARALAERVGPNADRIFVGHCSGASGLDALAPLPAHTRFSLHPLMTFAGELPCALEGVTAAVAGHGTRALMRAIALAEDLGMTALEIEESDRVAYHAAASIASNFLVTLESAAETLAASAGCGRQALATLVRQTVENWAANGSISLTGPIARGDALTVARQRQAVAERTPQLLEMFDALTHATEELAAEVVAL